MGFIKLNDKAFKILALNIGVCVFLDRYKDMVIAVKRNCGRHFVSAVFKYMSYVVLELPFSLQLGLCCFYCL